MKTRNMMIRELRPLGVWAMSACLSGFVLAGESAPGANASPAPVAGQETSAPAEEKATIATEEKQAPAAEEKDGVETETEPAAENGEKAAPVEDQDVEADLPAHLNWFDISVGGLRVDGDEAQFQFRHSMPRDAFGGVEDFHYQRMVGKKAFFQMDGRGIFDANDYSLTLELVQPELGFVRGGYREYRTWYDPSGGFFPQSEAWFSLFDDELTLDRGRAWIEAGLTLPDKPQFTVRYTHEFRNGLKDSTIWGESNLTSPGPSPSVPPDPRGFVPSLLEVDEQRHLFEGDVRHTVGKTDLGLGIRYETSKIENTLKARRRPGEGPLNDRYLTHREKTTYDVLGFNGFTETRFNEKIWLTTGYGFTSLDTDLAGSRIYGEAFEVGYNPALASHLGFYDLGGGSQMKQYVMHLNLMTIPKPHFTLVPSIRVERLDLDNLSTFVLTGPGAPRIREAVSHREFIDVAEQLEARYSGVTNWVFYARGNWEQGQGDFEETGGAGATLDAIGPDRFTEDTRLTQRYTVGANWYPLRTLNIDSQYYHKIRDIDYDHRRDSTPNNSGNRYPAYFTGQTLVTDDVNARVTYRPFRQLTLVGRYDFQITSIDTMPDATSGLSETQSGQIYSHIFGFNVSWIPWYRLYLQPAIHYVVNRTDTPADRYSVSVVDARNDYWNASLTAGYVLDNKTDLQAHYFYYRADNYEDISPVGMPYGAGSEEHGVTLALIRRINDHWRWTLKYGFFNNRDETSGGHNDYDAHLLYTSVQYLF